MRKRIPEQNKIGPLTRAIAITVGIAFFASGCSFRQKETDVHHQWGLCTVLGAATGGIIGAGLGFAAAQAISSSASTEQPNICPGGGLIPVGGTTCTLIGINATAGGINASSAKRKHDKDK